MTSPSIALSLFANVRRTVVVHSAMLFFSICFTSPVKAQEPVTLEPNKPVERSLKGGEPHIYQVELKTGQFMHVEIEPQVGFDLVLSLYAPDGKLLAELKMDGLLWREAVSCVAASDGVYRIDVRTISKDALPGNYTIIMGKLHKPDELDRKRIAAEQAFNEGQKIYLEGTKNTAVAAVKPLEMATELWSQVGDKKWQSVALMYRGWLLNSLNKNDEALAPLSQALVLLQEVKDRVGEGKALNALGLVYKDLKQFDKAKERFDQALAIRRAMNDRRGEANTLWNLARTAKDSGQLEVACDRYLEMIAIKRKVKDRVGEADALKNLATIYYSLGEHDKAVQTGKGALSVLKDLNDPGSEAETLYNLAVVYNNLGEYEKARENYEAALAIRRAQKDRGSESIILISLGSFYYFSLHDNQKAKENFELGLVASRDAKLRSFETLALTGLGFIADNLKQHQEAIDYYQKALAIAREEKNFSNETLVIASLGGAYSSLKQYEQAKDYYQQYLHLTRQRQDRNAEGLALSNLGNLYSRLSEYENSVAFYREAQKLLHESGNPDGETLALTGLGFVSYNLNDFERAQGYFEQGLAISRVRKNRPNENLALLGLGGTQLRLNQYDQAKVSYELALEISRNLKDKGSEANILNSLGTIYTEISQYEKATECHSQALTNFRELKDRSGESNALISLGNVEYYLARYEKAKEFYEQALAIKLEANEKQGKDVALNNLGAVSNDLNQYDKAKDLFDQAAVVSREIRNRVTEGLTTRNVGGVFFNDRNQYEKARGFYQQALATSREIKDRKGEGGALNDLGNVSRHLGQFEASRDYYLQALAIFREIKNRVSEAAVLNDLGTLYNSLKQHEKARGYFEQALVIRREVKDRRGEASTLDSLGLVDKNVHEYEKAQNHFSQALAIFREIKIRRGEAGSLNNLGEVKNLLNQPQAAREDLEQALTIFREIKDRRSEGNALDNLGIVYQGLKQYAKADSSFQLALTIYREIKDKQDEGDTLKHLMENSKLAGKTRMAVLYGKQTVNAFQEMRGNIKGFEQDTRQSFLRDKEPAYRLLATLLISQGRLPEARGILDLLKEEEFGAAVQRTGGADSVPFSPDERKAVDAASQVVEIGREYDELDRKGGSLSEADQKRKLILYNRLVAANAEFAEALKRLSTSVKGDGETYKTASTKAKAFQLVLKKLGPGTVALYTVVNTNGDGKATNTSDALVILVTPSFERAYPIDVTRFDEDILEFQIALKNSAYDPLPLAQKLYRKIFLQPSGAHGNTLAADLDIYLRGRSDKVLMWSLDGVLRYIPFAALHDGKQYLVEKYRNTVINPERAESLLLKPQPHWTALGLGVSEDREEAGLHFPALSGANRELKRIVKDEESSLGILPGVIRENKAFTREAMLMMLLNHDHPVVHISSHFSFQPANFEQSFLLLGQGRWTVEEMSKETSLFADVDLLTLSACDTAMGQANGKEAEGFAYRAQRLGAQAVIASLWPVDDIGTQVLMPLFYRLRETGLTKAEAFQRAQLALLHGEQKELPNIQRASRVLAAPDRGLTLNRYAPDPQRPFAHPYYWAPFILIGNWN